MGFEMARRLAKSGCDIAVWNRTRAKAEPLAKDGAKVADSLPDLAGCDIVFCMVSTFDDVKEVIAGPKGLLSKAGGKGRVPRMAEVTVLAQKAGVPRHAFLDFLNTSVMGSTFTRYKAPAFVNLDFHVTFTPYLLRKDLDLGLEAGRKFEVPMPLASITRDLVQSMMGQGMSEEDFSTLLLQQARASGLELKPENKTVGDGLSL